MSLKFKEGDEVKIVDGWAEGCCGVICTYSDWGVYKDGCYFLKVNNTEYIKGDCHRVNVEYLEKLTPLEKTMR